MSKPRTYFVRRITINKCTRCGFETMAYKEGKDVQSPMMPLNAPSKKKTPCYRCHWNDYSTYAIRGVRFLCNGGEPRIVLEQHIKEWLETPFCMKCAIEWKSDKPGTPSLWRETPERALLLDPRDWRAPLDGSDGRDWSKPAYGAAIPILAMPEHVAKRPGASYEAGKHEPSTDTTPEAHAGHHEENK